MQILHVFVSFYPTTSFLHDDYSIVILQYVIYNTIDYMYVLLSKYILLICKWTLLYMNPQ